MDKATPFTSGTTGTFNSTKTAKKQSPHAEGVGLFSASIQADKSNKQENVGNGADIKLITDLYDDNYYYWNLGSSKNSSSK